jgi:hypothetical protein
MSVEARPASSTLAINPFHQVPTDIICVLLSHLALPSQLSLAFVCPRIRKKFLPADVLATMFAAGDVRLLQHFYRTLHYDTALQRNAFLLRHCIGMAIANDQLLLLTWVSNNVPNWAGPYVCRAAVTENRPRILEWACHADQLCEVSFDLVNVAAAVADEAVIRLIKRIAPAAWTHTACLAALRRGISVYCTCVSSESMYEQYSR